VIRCAVLAARRSRTPGALDRLDEHDGLTSGFELLELERCLRPVLVLRVAERGVDLLEPCVLGTGFLCEHVLDVTPRQLAHFGRDFGPGVVAPLAELILPDEMAPVNRADREREVRQFASPEELAQLPVDHGVRADFDTLLEELEIAVRSVHVDREGLLVREHDERLAARSLVQLAGHVVATERLVDLEEGLVAERSDVAHGKCQGFERAFDSADVDFRRAGLGRYLLVAVATAPDLADRARDRSWNSRSRDVLEGHLLCPCGQSATGLCQSAADLVDVDPLVHRTVELGQEFPDLLVPEQHANLPFSPLALSLWGSGIEKLVRPFRTCDQKLSMGWFFVNSI